jgi:large subunit ribosomal protein L24
MQRIRKGDDVMVIAGRDKGKRGSVVKHVGEEHLIVDGVNRVKKHQRPNPMKGQQGGIIDKDMPIHISNIALFNAQTGKPDRVGIKTVGTGEQARKVRIFKSTGELVDPVK